jgi:hypothetical protein
MSMIKTALVRALALAVLASMAVACGGGEEKAAKEQAAAAAAAKKSKAKGKAGDGAGAAAVDDGLANAVAVGKAAAAVDLRYGLATKPAVGQPFEVDLTFIPRVAADTLEVEATGMPGLVLAGGVIASFGPPVTAGERYSTKVLAQVTETGLFYISITAKLASKVQTDARTFSVPVVVGPLPAAEKASAGSKAAEPGATVKSTPAVETTK